MKTNVFLSIAILIFSAFTASAQTMPAVQGRQTEQQERIAAGRATGSLTPRETRRLEREQAKIQMEKNVAKADGVITPAERARLARKQHKASRHIAHEKHDLQVRGR